jgi:hypothetical protein
MKAARPFSRAMRTPSLLSSSLSWAKIYPEAQWPPHLKETEPYTNQQAETSVLTRSKPRQALAQSKNPPDRWRCLTRGGIHSSLMGWQWAAIMVRAPTTRTLAVVSPTSHHEQWSGVSFKVSGNERRFLSQLIKDRKSKGSTLASRYLHHRENQSSCLEPTLEMFCMMLELI